MNQMTIYIIAGIILVGLIAYFIFTSGPKSGLDGYFISTQSESNERIKNLGLDKPSENASYILNKNALSLPDVERETEDVDYKPNPDKDWVINLIPINGEAFKKSDFTKMFDYDWRRNFNSTIYGFSAEQNRWTYADAGGTPDIYSELQVAIDVQDVYNDKNPDFDPKKLERYIVELEKRIKQYPTRLKLEQTESVESAVQKAKGLVSLYQQFNNYAILILQSNSQFNGIEMWDALQSVGLNWGDEDLFHWNNETAYGHGQYFSVWTTTEPGYFLPEKVRDGNMNPQNLVFGFSVPRSADPKNIFDIMINVVKYCQNRLGGQILDRNMQPFDEEREKQALSELVKAMKNKGIEAGSDKALKMF